MRRPQALGASLAAGGTLLVVALWAGVAWSSRLPVAAPILVTVAYVERADTVRRNETLSHLFARHNIYGNELAEVLQAADGLNPKRIRPRQVFAFRYPVNGTRPNRVTVRLGDERVLTLSKSSAGTWTSSSADIVWTVRLERVAGEIRSSVYETIDELIPDSVLPRSARDELIWDLADGVFGWVIDFSRDIYPGDGLQLLFERLTSPEGDVRYGRIVAAKIETRGVEKRAYVLTDEQGRNAYYDAEGVSLRRAFKLRPVRYKRISSRFSRRRYHPVLRRYRAHLGVDFAATRNAGIEATGNGVVTRAGRWGGYGIMVSIRHPKGIETRYAHMSRLAAGIKPGVRVGQGQVIGYVGASGLANAPHVHYEFLINARHRDPRSYQRGDGEPVPAAQRIQFAFVKTRYDRLLQAQPVKAATAAVD